MQKKGLSAFIKKQQTKKEKKTTAEAAATNSEQQKAQDVEADAKKDQMDKNTTSKVEKKEESSDEEEDELDIAKKQINYNKIIEKEIISSNAKAGDQDKKIGYGYEDEAKENSQAEEKEKKPAKKSGQGIVFSGGKPSFGNRNKNLGGAKIMNDAFGGGLEDLEDEGTSKKKDKKGGPKESTSSAPKEEEKESGKLTGVKPTFKGRMNLRGGGGPNDGDNAGVVKDYSFNVTFKSEAAAGGERKQHGAGGGDRNVDRKGRGGPKDKGMSLGDFNQQKNANDDEGFTIVGRDTRKEKKSKKNDSSSDEEDDGPSRGFKRNPAENVRGARVERGGNRGGRGRE